MLEVRAARSDELDTMLAIMCEAFGLPFGPARDLFYKDPYFDISKKRVLAEDGLLVSCLTIVDSPLWIGRAPVRVGGIAGVGTRVAHRGRGHAARLMLETLAALREQGYGLAALFPFSYPYYRRLGWEQAGSHYRIGLIPAGLPRFTDARHVRPASASDRADMQALYEARNRHRTGRWVRDERRWLYLLEHVPGKVVFKRGVLEGYAWYEVKTEGDGPRRLRLLELIAATDAARRGLTGYFADHTDAAEIEYVASAEDLRESGLLDVAPSAAGPEPPRIDLIPGVMVRVVDLAQALKALTPNFAGLNGQLALVMHDEHAPPGAPLAVELCGDGNQVAVEPFAGAGTTRWRLEGDVRAWSQVLAGYLSLRDALSLNRLSAYSEAAAALAEPLFPRRHPFIPPADHF